MAYRQEEKVAEIISESGILKGRKPWQRLRAETIEQASGQSGPERPNGVLAANATGGEELQHQGRHSQ
jgi:hypothetical protein